MNQYTMKEFIEGKFGVKVNKNNCEDFLKMCAKHCLLWGSGEKANKFVPNFDTTESEIAIKCEERFDGNEICLVYGRCHVFEQFGIPVIDCKDFMGSSAHFGYQILIDCDGTTTTATMTINDREIKTAIARRNPADEFDWRKGSALAFERLWNSPKKLGKKPEVREVKRWAKPGEYIKFSSVHGDCERYKNGDILKVESVIEVCGEDGFTQIACCGVIATPDEYVVLEGYRP